jgi:hypothetical protein
MLDPGQPTPRQPFQTPLSTPDSDLTYLRTRCAGELSPGTPRSYQGILEQAKKRLVAASPAQPAMAGVLAVRTAAARRHSPTITLTQMAAEVLSVRPNMQVRALHCVSAVMGLPERQHCVECFVTY